MIKNKAKKPSIKKLSHMQLVCILAGILVLLGTLLSVRLRRIDRAVSEVTATPGSVLGVTDVQWFEQQSSRAMQPPQEGHRYITVSLGVTNLTNQSQWVTPVTQSYITDSNGIHHGLELVVTDDPFQAGPVDPGASTKGEVSYMVPSADEGLKLCYVLDGPGREPSCLLLNDYNRKQ